jgi:hypothetical protein
MKKYLVTLTMILSIINAIAQTTAGDTKPAFNPTIKMKALLHSRFEASLTDSVDVQGKVVGVPIPTNFRLRRVELRSDIKLNDHWSGVIRIQLPELKSATPTMGRVIELAYFEYKHSDQFSLRGGQFKEPFELDELTSHEDLRMVDRGPTSRMFVNNNYSSYNPGLMIFGTFLQKTTPLSYYIGVFNGGDRSVNYDSNYGKAFVGRVEFTPISGLRLGLNGQVNGVAPDISANAAGADVSWQQKLNDKLNLIVEGEYIGGNNIISFVASSDSLKEISSYKMNGYFGQFLFRYKVAIPGLQTLELGGKFEHTDPLSSDEIDQFNTITGGIGFVFLPDNAVRLQLNMVHTGYTENASDAFRNFNYFVAQLQLKI